MKRSRFKKYVNTNTLPGETPEQKKERMLKEWGLEEAEYLEFTKNTYGTHERIIRLSTINDIKDVDDVIYVRNYLRRIGWEVADNGDVIAPRIKIYLTEEINKAFLAGYHQTGSKFKGTFSSVTKILFINTVVLLVLGLAPHIYSAGEYIAKAILEALDPSSFTEQIQLQESNHHMWGSKFKKGFRKANGHGPRYSGSRTADYSRYLGEADSFNEIYGGDDMETSIALGSDPEYNGHILSRLVDIEDLKNSTRKNNFRGVNWGLRQCDLARHDEYLDWVEDTKPKINLVPEKKYRGVEIFREQGENIRRQKPARVEWVKIRNKHYKKKWGSHTGKIYGVKQYGIGYEGKITLSEPWVPKNRFPTAESPEALLKLKKKIKRGIVAEIVHFEDYITFHGPRLTRDHLLTERNPSYWGRFITPKIPTRRPFFLSYLDHHSTICNTHYKRLFPIDPVDKLIAGLMHFDRDISDLDLGYGNRNGFAKRRQPISGHLQYIPRFTLAFCLVISIYAIWRIYVAKINPNVIDFVERNERWYQEDFGMLKLQIVYLYRNMEDRAGWRYIRFPRLWAIGKSINTVFRSLSGKNIQVVFRGFIGTVTPYLLAFGSGIFFLHFGNTYIRYWKGNHLLPMLVRHVQGNKRRRQYIMNYEDQLHIPFKNFVTTKGIRRKFRLSSYTDVRNDIREDIIRHGIEQNLDEWPEETSQEEEQTLKKTTENIMRDGRKQNLDQWSEEIYEEEEEEEEEEEQTTWEKTIEDLSWKGAEQTTRDRTTADLSREEAIEYLAKITKIPEEPSLLPYLEFFADEHSEYFIMCFLC